MHGQVGEQGSNAHQNQNDQQSDLLLVEVELGGGGIGQLHPVGDGLDGGQKHGQGHGLQGEHEQVLENAGQGQHNIVVAVHDILEQHINGGLQQDVDKQTDAETAEDDLGGGDLLAVEEQGEDDGAGDLRQHIGQEVGIATEHNAQYIGHDGTDGADHGAVDHGAQGVGHECGGDVQAGAQRDADDGLQGHTHDHDHGGEDQHFGVLQLGQGVTPVACAEGVGITGGGFLFGHRIDLLDIRAADPMAPEGIPIKKPQPKKRLGRNSMEIPVGQRNQKSR